MLALRQRRSAAINSKLHYARNALNTNHPYYLFRRGELEERFNGRSILLSIDHCFDAPENTRKEFSTIVAQKNC